MLFRKKRKVVNLVDILRRNPNEAFVCEEYVAVWSPALQRALIFKGDYRGMTDEEINLHIQARLDYTID
jgi:hypothetical protein